MSTPKLIFRATAVVIIALVIYAANQPQRYTPMPQTAKESDQQVIDLCWQDYGKKSNTPAHARLIASVCEDLEAKFKQNYP